MRMLHVCLLVLAASLLMLGMGSQCPSSPGNTTPTGGPSGATSIRIELENATGQQIENGYYYNGTYSPSVLPPGETTVYTPPCGSGTRLRFVGHAADLPFRTDAVPVEITAGVEYSCGNTVHVAYTISGNQVVNTVTVN